ncbi:hypothetical protein CXF85_09735 [Colwellia sp. 75C3]|nr:hypothetical protein CXF85_09735 [Colwellia sp. 75C3]
MIAIFSRLFYSNEVGLLEVMATIPVYSLIVLLEMTQSKFHHSLLKALNTNTQTVDFLCNTNSDKFLILLYEVKIFQGKALD